MPPAAGTVSQHDRVPMAPVVIPTVVQPAPAMMSETFAKDAIIAWFRGEFAAANAIIDALCSHLTQLEGGGIGGRSDYDSVFAAIHRRRLNWIPILQMQKYYSIADVAQELQKVAAKKTKEMPTEKEVIKCGEAEKEKNPDSPISEEDLTAENNEIGYGEVVDEHSAKDDSPESEITDTGSHQEVQTLPESNDICSNHDDCEARRDEIKITKGFSAKEPVKGHLVNIVRGLKLYEDVFTESELSKLNDFVNELRVAGRNGELSGETFILYNQQVKGNKREMIQLGVPIFGHIQEDDTTKCRKNHIEPIPALLQGIVEHLVQWHIISESRKPNGCIINFFDEGEYSQPFLKPPHVDQPLSTLLLSKSAMAFGRTLVNDNDGNYRGPLVLSLKEGSLLVMRGNSSDVARHVMCSSPNKRVSITFVRIRVDAENNSPRSETFNNKAVTLWHPGVPTPHPAPNGALNGFGQEDMVPKWGAALRAPLLMLAPLRPVVVSPRRVPRGGTGVFLPWTVGPRKPVKHLPPRAQKGRALALPSNSDACKPVNGSDPTMNVEQKVM